MLGAQTWSNSSTSDGVGARRNLSQLICLPARKASTSDMAASALLVSAAQADTTSRYARSAITAGLGGALPPAPAALALALTDWVTAAACERTEFVTFCLEGGSPGFSSSSGG